MKFVRDAKRARGGRALTPASRTSIAPATTMAKTINEVGCDHADRLLPNISTKVRSLGATGHAEVQLNCIDAL